MLTTSALYLGNISIKSRRVQLDKAWFARIAVLCVSSQQWNELADVRFNWDFKSKLDR